LIEYIKSLKETGMVFEDANVLVQQVEEYAQVPSNFLAIVSITI
jgi:hypothetical protein